MAWQQWRVLDALTTESNDSGTVRIKLPQSNVLHSMLIRTNMDNGATNAQGLTMSDVVDSVKVVANGSHVIYHLEPETIRAMSLLQLGRNFYEVVDEQGGNTQEAHYPVLFGSTWFDPNHWLPLTAFDDIELQIAYSPSIAATSFATGTFDHEVLGLMTMEGNPGDYQGTYRTRIVKNFTSAASGDEVTKLPVGERWKYLLVRCYEAGVADGTDLTDVKFEVNDGERVYLDMKWDALVNLNQTLHPIELNRKIIIDQTDADTTNVDQSRILSVQCNDLVADVLTTITAITGDQLTIQMTDQSSQAVNEGGTATYTIHAAESADNAVQLLVSSEQIPFSVFVPLDGLLTGELFDSSQWDNVKLTLTNGAAGGDTDIVLTEVPKYA